MRWSNCSTEAGCNWMRYCLKPASLWLDTAPLKRAREFQWASAEVAWVYEVFITTLPIDGFLVEDVLDLYHGRGADHRRYLGMKMSKRTQTAGVRTRSADRNSDRSRVNGYGTFGSRSDRPCKKLSCATPSWASPKKTPPVLLTIEKPVEEYGPWE